jgi:hypothetical protein
MSAGGHFMAGGREPALPVASVHLGRFLFGAIFTNNPDAKTVRRLEDLRRMFRSAAADDLRDHPRHRVR